MLAGRRLWRAAVWVAEWPKKRLLAGVAVSVSEGGGMFDQPGVD